MKQTISRRTFLKGVGESAVAVSLLHLGENKVAYALTNNNSESIKSAKPSSRSLRKQINQLEISKTGFTYY